jgi:hypothetical protein
MVRLEVEVGDGEGEGVVACAAGAATSRAVMRTANSAPRTFRSLLDCLLDGSLDVLLKLKNLHLGVV